jgi:hypothetical protein
LADTELDALPDDQRQAGGRRLALLVRVGRAAGHFGASTRHLEADALVVVVVVLIVVVIVFRRRFLRFGFAVFVGGFAGRRSVFLGGLRRGHSRPARPQRDQSQDHPPPRHRRPRTLRAFGGNQLAESRWRDYAAI